MTSMLSQFIHSFNWVDLIFALMLVSSILSSRGFINSATETVGFIGSLIGAYLLYPYVGILFTNLHMPLTPGILQATAFMVSWIVLETLFFILIEILLTRIPSHIHHNPVNRITGYAAAAFQACVVALVIISVIFSFPVRGTIKADIISSQTGHLLLKTASALEGKVKGIFGGAIHETVSFMTIKPSSDETVHLGFKVPRSMIHPDPESESIMFTLVNKERAKVGDATLESDETLQKVAREYAATMLENGFFAHTSEVDGTTVADRIQKHGVDYVVVGENLAFAADVNQAHEGLMNSPGHRKNILSKDYGRVGIGIMDAGIYGKMFVQVFRN